MTILILASFWKDNIMQFYNMGNMAWSGEIKQNYFKKLSALETFNQ